MLEEKKSADDTREGAIMKKKMFFVGMLALGLVLAGTPLFAQTNPSGSLYIVFPGFRSNLGTVSTELAVQNAAAFASAAKTLLENPNYRLLVDGHANPVRGTSSEERDELKPLSQQRAEAVADFLVSYYGIARNRLIVVASGGTAPSAESASTPNLKRAVSLTLVP
jgi:hypothetical protein